MNQAVITADNLRSLMEVFLVLWFLSLIGVSVVLPHYRFCHV